ncbi:hypothetical protein E3U43_001274 [Larimichthys crocea]|uniref:Uncharacterized protein n=1 Tax=Larimichthys crocea TaxID=215358 RepID=A0ACD3RCR6_LARCR|nr:hypothetical protein E3U43_001274 [Larimichthys crocea]
MDSRAGQDSPGRGRVGSGEALQKLRPGAWRCYRLATADNLQSSVDPGHTVPSPPEGLTHSLEQHSTKDATVTSSSQAAPDPTSSKEKGT